MGRGATTGALPWSNPPWATAAVSGTQCPAEPYLSEEADLQG